jgi:hypothetical protein
MSSFLSSVSYRPQPSTAQPPSTFAPQSRGERGRELLSQVIPSALGIGIKGLEALQTTQSGKIAAAATVAKSGSMPGSAAGTAAGTATMVGGVMGAIDLIANWGASTPTRGASSGMAIGATLGTMIGGPGLGTAIGAALGTLAGGLIGAITSGKHKDQKVRDEMRSFLVQNGVLDSKYQLQLADGSMYNMGLDGGPRAEFGGRRPYEIDLSNPLAKYAISWVNPLIEFIAQGNPKLKTDFVGYFANAAMSNAKTLDDVRQNVNAFMKRFGVTDEALAQAVIQAGQSGKLDPGVAAAYVNGIQERANPSFTGSFDLPVQASAENTQEVGDLDGELE